MRSGPNNRRQNRRGGGGGGGRRGGQPRSQSIDSNGPDIKVRGNAQQVVDKYQALAREAATTGDPVMAENYYQHAEHYFRVLGANGAAENRQDNRNNARQADGDGIPPGNGTEIGQQKASGKTDNGSSETSKKEIDAEENPINGQQTETPVSAAGEVEEESSVAQPSTENSDEVVKSA